LISKLADDPTMASAVFRNGRQHWRQISKLAAVAGPAGLPSNVAVRHFASEAGSASGSSGTVSELVVRLHSSQPASAIPVARSALLSKVASRRNGLSD